MLNGKKFAPGSMCPMLGKACVESQCAWWTHLRGMNPQTGQEIDQQACAMVTLPVLLIENSQQQRSTGAAVESFRNEMVKGNDQLASVLLERTLLPPGIRMIERGEDE
jgi:hypothetical protein